MKYPNSEGRAFWADLGRNPTSVRLAQPQSPTAENAWFKLRRVGVHSWGMSGRPRFILYFAKRQRTDGETGDPPPKGTPPSLVADYGVANKIISSIKDLK
jgi:hypothetical protein